MDINRFFKTVLSQNAEDLMKYFQRNAVIKWHCTNELFTLDEYIKANCEYPGMKIEHGDRKVKKNIS
mgnify:CR=1 FL=1